jgi:hypothetical protein
LEQALLLLDFVACDCISLLFLRSAAAERCASAILLSVTTRCGCGWVCLRAHVCVRVCMCPLYLVISPGVCVRACMHGVERAHVCACVRAYSNETLNFHLHSLSRGAKGQQTCACVCGCSGGCACAYARVCARKYKGTRVQRHTGSTHIEQLTTPALRSRDVM